MTQGISKSMARLLLLVLLLCMAPAGAQQPQTPAQASGSCHATDQQRQAPRLRTEAWISNGFLGEVYCIGRERPVHEFSS